LLGGLLFLGVQNKMYTIGFACPLELQLL